MNSKHHKSDAFQVAIQLLVGTAKNIYMRTQVLCVKRLNVEKQFSVLFMYDVEMICLCSHIYFFCSDHKQLNGDLKDITFMILAVHEQVASATIC